MSLGNSVVPRRKGVVMHVNTEFFYVIKEAQGLLEKNV